MHNIKEADQRGDLSLSSLCSGHDGRFHSTLSGYHGFEQSQVNWRATVIIALIVSCPCDFECTCLCIDNSVVVANV